MEPTIHAIVANYYNTRPANCNTNKLHLYICMLPDSCWLCTSPSSSTQSAGGSRVPQWFHEIYLYMQRPPSWGTTGASGPAAPEVHGVLPQAVSHCHSRSTIEQYIHQVRRSVTLPGAAPLVYKSAACWILPEHLHVECCHLLYNLRAQCLHACSL